MTTLWIVSDTKRANICQGNEKKNRFLPRIADLCFGKCRIGGSLFRYSRRKIFRR